MKFRNALPLQLYKHADGVNPRIYGGTGLGMPIVKRMVDRMEGTITIKSQPSQGSTLSILVPLQRVLHHGVAA
ncbi:ATP-binding protein [Loktanella atrilutea]|uniref:ATP-binding protein n=1 Tax=Loktanella atrilutea TaxID=366533 RepID=UPI003CCBA1C1